MWNGTVCACVCVCEDRFRLRGLWGHFVSIKSSVGQFDLRHRFLLHRFLFSLLRLPGICVKPDPSCRDCDGSSFLFLLWTSPIVASSSFCHFLSKHTLLKRRVSSASDPQIPYWSNSTNTALQKYFTTSPEFKMLLKQIDVTIIRRMYSQY